MHLLNSSICSIYEELCTDRSDVDALCVLEVGGEGGEQSVEAPVVAGVDYDDSPHRPRGEDAQPRSVRLWEDHRGGEREENGGGAARRGKEGKEEAQEIREDNEADHQATVNKVRTNIPSQRTAHHSCSRPK